MAKNTLFHELENTAKTRGHRVTILSLQMLILLKSTTNEHQFSANKCVFQRDFQQIPDSMAAGIS
jgi:hypothetical protein